MIKSFADRETESIWSGRRSRRLPGEIQVIALRKLRLINAANSVNDLRIPPRNRLEMLKGNRSGQYSIPVNDQWRICFTWQEGEANNVEITDYH
ncbi:type II toxin-antitoxin system RelE/ParE family toxin [Pararhizobium sp. PWRC1-1]|uniref:type II toxin-antitoxin system RelE/ParE family toxin n=1 Tax=Pararhizobium sp. PWRC1-1 TaxID=2804566 RepID=UPI003CF037A7